MTGHKIWNRYKESGIGAVKNRSRAPHSHPNQTPFDVEQLLIRLKKEKPHWGAPKLRELVLHRHPQIKPPAVSTIHCILDRHGLVKKKKRRRKFTSIAGYLSTPRQPNDLWCTDCKGQFNMKRPCDVYEPSAKKYGGLSDLTYPGFDKTLLVSNCGRICLNRMKIHMSRAFANQPIGLQEVEENIWSVHFMDYHLGFFDEYSRKFAPRQDPFGIKLDKVI